MVTFIGISSVFPARQKVPLPIIMAVMATGAVVPFIIRSLAEAVAEDPIRRVPLVAGVPPPAAPPQP
jgi:hypothetical protein